MSSHLTKIPRLMCRYICKYHARSSIIKNLDLALQIMFHQEKVHVHEFLIDRGRNGSRAVGGCFPTGKGGGIQTPRAA